VLAIGPKGGGFKPSRNTAFLREIKICNAPSFAGEVKPKAPCHKILWQKKSLASMNRNILKG
jgi:hypothetical protein